jgi:uroporphyrin-3 C-methyltransferase/uroporphyrinogen III methyltransferase/synthase
MNEFPSAPELKPAPQSENGQSAPPRSTRPSSDGAVRTDMSYEANKLLYTGLTVLAVLLAAQWWVSHAEMSSLRAEVARRLQSADVSNTETKLQVKTTHDIARELQSKVSVLESKQAEAQSQQLALDALYQELSRNRDDWALAEIEQVLSTASQQLQRTRCLDRFAKRGCAFVAF